MEDVSPEAASRRSHFDEIRAFFARQTFCDLRICGRDPREAVDCHRIVLLSVSKTCRQLLTPEEDALQFAEIDSTRIRSFVHALYAALGQDQPFEDDPALTTLDGQVFEAFQIQTKLAPPCPALPELPESVQQVMKRLDTLDSVFKSRRSPALNIATHLKIKYEDSRPVYEFHVKDEPMDFGLGVDDDLIAVHDADRYSSDFNEPDYGYHDGEDFVVEDEDFDPPGSDDEGGLADDGFERRLSVRAQRGQAAIRYVRSMIKPPARENQRERKQRLAKLRVFKQRMSEDQPITKRTKHILSGVHLSDLDSSSAERVRELLFQSGGAQLNDLIHPPANETPRERRSRMVALARKRKRAGKPLEEQKTPKKIKYLDDDESVESQSQAPPAETKDDTTESEDSDSDGENSTDGDKRSKKKPMVILGTKDSAQVLEVLKKNLAFVSRGAGDETDTVDVNGALRMIKHAHGVLPVSVTTLALRHEGQIGRTVPLLTTMEHESLAIFGISASESGEIRGKPLAWSDPEQDFEVKVQFDQTAQAFSQVYGLPQATVLNSRAILSHQEWSGEPRGNSYSDLYKRLFNTATRPELEQDLQDPVLIEATTPPEATYAKVQLPLKNWPLQIDPALEAFQEIVVIGLYPHAIDCKRIARIEDPTQFAFLCMRILFLVWGRGNGKFKIRLPDPIIDRYMDMGRIVYRKHTCEKLLAQEGELPRNLPVRTCELCGITITENSNLSKWSRHLLQHKIETYQCSCDVLMNSFMDRKRHYKSHHHGKHGLPLEDPNANLKPVILRRPHSKRFAYVCNSCGLECADGTDLAKHIGVCDGLVQCQICLEKLFGLEKYYDHMRNSHDGKFDQTKFAYFFSNHSKFKQCKKKISCDQCPKTFVDPVVFKKHWAQIHGSESDRPYKCAECEKSFVNKANLKEHLLSVHIRTRPYICRYEGCKSDFNCSANLYAHEKKVHGEKLGSALSIHKVVTDEQMLQYSYILGNGP
ncbi:hypothetical protein TCAL_05053 [Tigriopus californicus]|uniref:C2H2-type domain-containing protein n=1 Tax=Tigriopus californicus TaxID=6832 RepID=A0A553P723_TIGCA|nr:uncharacterized protein LOC131878483 [Tigriopus californicus]TRY73486.1 hypothetical protein TCAL_05053 [Tigriopus californicus]|eukprot:TCALIF_05053-PA protein Name:"Similar to Zbtb17 Zinc finger and BTB domain-containing protein 17 (Mus musculus)" AED:0.78 eAED:0.78 QI:0/-1/0/1/-1/1/1/0/985